MHNSFIRCHTITNLDPKLDALLEYYVVFCINTTQSTSLLCYDNPCVTVKFPLRKAGNADPWISWVSIIRVTSQFVKYNNYGSELEPVFKRRAGHWDPRKLCPLANHRWLYLSSFPVWGSNYLGQYCMSSHNPHWITSKRNSLVPQPVEVKALCMFGANVQCYANGNKWFSHPWNFNL